MVLPDSFTKAGWGSVPMCTPKMEVCPIKTDTFFGTWYEIARTPSKVSNNLTCIATTFKNNSLSHDNLFFVTSVGLNITSTSNFTLSGNGTVIDPAKFRIDLPIYRDLLNKPNFIVRNVWVDLKGNYQRAVISSPNSTNDESDSYYVLSRSKLMSQIQLEAATKFASQLNTSTQLDWNLPKEFLRFVDASPSPFHAVESSIQRLVKAGFQEIQEENSWDNLKPNGKYFFTRNRSAIVSFVIGGKWKQGNGFSIVGAHTDSPCLKVKPRSKRDKLGYKQGISADILNYPVGVEIYGGGLWHTWFDRDLSLAGRVLIESNGIFEHKLVKINRPILRIPTLAIHLDRNSGDNFTFNKEVQLTPILTEAAAKELNKTKTETESDRHHPEMLELIAKEMGCEGIIQIIKNGILKSAVEFTFHFPSNIAQIRDFELCLYDTQPASIGGANDEFIHSARLDNLMMSFCGLTAICETTDESVKNDDLIRMVTLFDNEEVGSTTAHGADSNLLEVTLRRLSSLAVGAVEEGSFERAMVKSMLISADMAHALHPNYPEKHEDNHRPAMNKGVVIKQNANQRYATTSITTHILREAAAIASVKLQEFVVRNDSPCGSTIGPMLSAKLGLRTVDVGNPQWSMHSIRETCGTKDVGDAVLLFKAFFDGLSKIDSKMPRL
ncbi:hypothetical protein HDV02_002580 [Globomyces sp. JEL0801]|nr:hypothetical protein HDV02_002580 [Globomyces sp. JEL0801]